MPTRCNARRSTQPVRRCSVTQATVSAGDTAWCTRFERARPVDDRWSRVLLRRPGAPQERAEHDDDERRRPQRDRRPVDAGRVFHRIRPGNSWLGGLSWVGFNNVGLDPNPTYSATIPLQAHAMFQGMFAIITPALISGAIVEDVAGSTIVLSASKAF